MPEIDKFKKFQSDMQLEEVSTFMRIIKHRSAKILDTYNARLIYRLLCSEEQKIYFKQFLSKILSDDLRFRFIRKITQTYNNARN